MQTSSIGYILREIRFRTYWMIFCFFLTSATSYYFSEDLFFALATPYLKISKTSFFLCTQITESLNTFITISIILGFVFSIPYLYYHLWCFFIPSCNKKQREITNKIVFSSILCFFFLNTITFICILPYIWLFLYKLSNTAVESQFFIIKLQPKIYDFSLLTIRVFFIASLCSQIPLAVFYSIKYNFISIQTCLKNRRIFWFVSILFAAFITPPDVWCQLVVWCSIILFVELTLFHAILQGKYSSISVRN